MRNRTDFTIQTVDVVRNGLESLSYLEPKSWETLPLDLKKTKFLIEFKAKIKRQNPHYFPCRLCKTYLQNIGLFGPHV